MQQALQKSQWPAELCGPASPKAAGTERHAFSTPAISDMGAVTAEVVVKQQGSTRLSVDHGSLITATGKKDDSQHGPVCSNTQELLVADAPQVASSHTPSHSLMGGLVHRLAGVLRSSTGQSNSVTTKAASAGRPTVSSIGDTAGSRRASLTQQFQRRASAESAISSDRGTSYTQTTSKGGRRSSITWLAAGKGGVKGGDAAAVRGLKVRMGVASGWVAANSDITRSALFKLAKGEQVM